MYSYLDIEVLYQKFLMSRVRNLASGVETMLFSINLVNVSVAQVVVAINGNPVCHRPP